MSMTSLAFAAHCPVDLGRVGQERRRLHCWGGSLLVRRQQPKFALVELRAHDPISGDQPGYAGIDPGCCGLGMLIHEVTASFHLLLGQRCAEHEVDVPPAPCLLDLGLAFGVRMLRFWMLEYGVHSGDNIRNSGRCSLTIAIARSRQCFRLKSQTKPSLAGTVRSRETPPFIPKDLAIFTTRGGL